MSLATRRDIRSVEQFANDIELNTAKEKVWSYVFQSQMEEKIGFCERIGNGVDNSGKIIQGDLKNNNVDYIFNFVNKLGCKKILPVEIKTIPEWLENFMTFKASSLIACVKQKGVLLVPKRYKFYLISNKTCKFFHDEYEHKIYKSFSPNDLAVRIPSKDINMLIKTGKIYLKDWANTSREMIESNWDFLSRERAKID